MQESIIIGIHGLLNKPPKDILEDWWNEAIREGLERNINNNECNFNFELAYWADVRNPEPIPLVKLEERYEKAQGYGSLERFDPKLFDKVRSEAQKWGGKVIDKFKDLIDIPSVERLIPKKFDDLAEYYSDETIRKKIRTKLSEKLEQHKDKKILLIAHSMGSIVAYDVLREFDRSNDIKVEHFITIGSPLGLPFVSDNIRDEFGKETRTPENVLKWTNMADRGDKVSIDFNLKDEYKPNSKGVRVSDVHVVNGYKNHEGKANNHKSYGYLRAPEFSEMIHTFCK
jgi:hypothetical protein